MRRFKEYLYLPWASFAGNAHTLLSRHAVGGVYVVWQHIVKDLEHALAKLDQAGLTRAALHVSMALDSVNSEILHRKETERRAANDPEN